MEQNKSDILLLKKKLVNNDFFSNSKLTASDFDDLKIKISGFKKGGKIYSLKDPARFIYLVIEGEIKLLENQSFGKAASIAAKNSFFGHEDYFLSAKRTSAAIAADDSVVALLSKENIDMILSRDNSILNNIGKSINNLNNVSRAEFRKAMDELYGSPKQFPASSAELKTADSSAVPSEDNSTPSSSVIDTNAVRSGLNKIFNNINENLSHLDAEENKLLTVISDYETRTNKLLDEIDVLKENEKKFIALNKEKNEMLGSQGYRITELEKEISKLMEAESENSKKIESLSELDAENKNSIKNLEAELNEKNAAISEYNSDAKKKELILSGIENNLREKEIIISRLEKDLEEKSEVISKLDKNLNENLKAVSDLNEARLNLLHQKEDQDKKAGEMKSELENLNKEIESLKVELTDKDKSLGGLRIELQDKQQEISGHNESLNKAEAEIVKLREILENKNEAIQNLSSGNEELREQIDEKDADKKNKDEYILSQSSKITGYEESLKNLKDEAARKEKIINNFIEEIGELSANLWRQQREIEEQNKIISEFQGKTNLLKKYSDSFINKEENFRKINSELNSERDSSLKMNNELAKIKSDVEEYKNALKEKETLIEKQYVEFENLKNTNSAITNSLDSLKSSYEEEIKKKEEHIAVLKDKIEKLQKIYEKETPGERSMAEILKGPAEKTAVPDASVNKSGTPKDLLQSIIDNEIYSNCKLVSFSCADKYSAERSFEHFQYSAVDIINVNCSRATMDIAPAFNKFLEKIITSERNKIIVNLLSCEYMDTSILGVLINSLKRAMSFKGVLVLVWQHQKEFSMLSLSKMNNIFRIFPNLKNAINSFP